jgi:hypothetical protein
MDRLSFSDSEGNYETSIDLHGRYAVLSENGDVIRCDVLTWTRILGPEGGYRRIRQEDLEHGCWISTVFLGLDHNYIPGGSPLWFETMIFDKHGDRVFCDRYSTFQEALVGHAAAKLWFSCQEFQNGVLVREPEADD